jgi:excisionase family DNA binding protein
LADYLGVPLGTVYQWSHRRQGPTSMRVGRHLRYRKADVERWLRTREREQAG